MGRSEISLEARRGGASAATSASDRVAYGIMQALEQKSLSPGQRLVETELAIQYGVGRNTVREAIRRLAERGIVDLSPNRSPSIRSLSTDEALEVLDVAEALTAMLARAAARRFDRPLHGGALQTAMDELAACASQSDIHAFSRARRHFYRALLKIAGNSELQRLFGAIHMEIVYAHYQSPRLQEMRFADYRVICAAIIAGNVKAAEVAGKRHVRHVRDVVVASRPKNTHGPSD